jgi:hypothetical protein
MSYLTPELGLETVLPCLQGSLDSPEAIGILATELNFKCEVVSEWWRLYCIYRRISSSTHVEKRARNIHGS